MVSFNLFREIALAFPEVTTEPHFEKISFRVKKKIFATYDEKTNLACIKLSEADQGVFSLIDKNLIYPVPNKWGQQGWTMLVLGKIEKELLVDALSTAYCNVAPKKLSEQVVPR